jgi:hypothetical protein
MKPDLHRLIPTMWAAPPAHYRIEAPTYQEEEQSFSLWAGTDYLGIHWADHSFGFRGRLYWPS